MSLVSVITAVHEPNFRYLDRAYESLRNQSLTDWDWVVQVDGGGTPDLPDDPRIHVGGNRPSGPGATRNMALSQTRCPIVRTLDADDALLPGALDRDVATLDAHPEIGWCVSPALDLLPDGSTKRWHHDDPPAGALPVGWIEERWIEDGRLPVLPSTLAIRRDLLLAVGGWMGLPTSEDTGLLVAAGSLAPGWFHDQPGNLYRQHDGQLTRSTHHVEQSGVRARRDLIIERTAALRALSGRYGQQVQ